MQLLIVEDQPTDLRVATTAARDCGFRDIEGRTSIAAARQFLEKAVEEEKLPDAIVLDLDLGYESGFEMLRYWHSHPQIGKVPLLVWTILGDQYREVCEVFKVSGYIDKGSGGAALSKALGGLAEAVS
ncbi:MAG: response regulator [Acidobacteriaceae bacterium]